MKTLIDVRNLLTVDTHIVEKILEKAKTDKYYDNVIIYSELDSFKTNGIGDALKKLKIEYDRNLYFVEYSLPLDKNNIKNNDGNLSILKRQKRVDDAERLEMYSKLLFLVFLVSVTSWLYTNYPLINPFVSILGLVATPFFILWQNRLRNLINMIDSNIAHFLNFLKHLARFWPLRWFIYISLFAYSKRVIGLEFKSLFSELGKEFRELLGLKPTPRALDAAAIIAVLSVGIMILGCKAGYEFMEFASEIGAKQAVLTLYEASSLYWLMLVLAVVAIASVLLTRQS